MLLYNVAINRRTLPGLSLFAYSYDKPITIGTLVRVNFRGSLVEGIVFETVAENNSISPEKIKPIDHITSLCYPISILNILRETAELYNISLHTLCHTFLPRLPKTIPSDTSISATDTPVSVRDKATPLQIYNSPNQADIYNFYAKIIQEHPNQPIVIICVYPRDALIIKQALMRYHKIHSEVFTPQLGIKAEYTLLTNIVQKRTRVIIGSRKTFFLPFPTQPIYILDQYLSPDHQSYEQKPLIDNRIVLEHAQMYTKTFASTYHVSPDLLYRHKQKKIELLNSIQIPPVHCVDMSQEIYQEAHRYISSTIITLMRDTSKSAFILNNKGTCVFFRCNDCREIFETQTNCPKCKGVKIKKISFSIDDLKKTLEIIFPKKKIICITKENKNEIKLNPQSIIIATSTLLYALREQCDMIAIINSDMLVQKEKYNAYDILCDQINHLTIYTKHLYIQAKNSASPLYQLYHRETFVDQLRQEIQERQLFGYPPFAFLIHIRSESPLVHDRLNVYTLPTKRSGYFYATKVSSLDEVKKLNKEIRAITHNFDIQINPEFEYGT